MFRKQSPRNRTRVSLASPEAISRIASDQGLTSTHITPSEYFSDLTIIGLHAWTASGVPDFQQQRWGAVAETLGVDVVLPDTPGQGLESPELTASQISQMSCGVGTALGEMMTDSVENAVAARQRTLGRTALVGCSQGASLIPTMIDKLPADAIVEKAVMYNAVGPRGFGLIPGMIISGGGGLKKYRKAEGTPEDLRQADDTDIVATVKKHPRNILLRYPFFMARQKFGQQLADAILDRGQGTEVIFVQGESDTASRKRATQKTVKYLNERGVMATYMGLPGHKHQMMEDTPAFISELQELLAPQLAA